MNWVRALEQCILVMDEIYAVREAGFTEEALKWPRSRIGLIALCAWNGIKPEQAPRGWHYWPNKGTMIMWERCIAAMREEFTNEAI